MYKYLWGQTCCRLHCYMDELVWVKEHRKRWNHRNGINERKRPLELCMTTEKRTIRVLSSPLTHYVTKFLYVQECKVVCL